MEELKYVLTTRLMQDLSYNAEHENNKIDMELYLLLRKLGVSSYADIENIRNLLSMLDDRMDSINSYLNSRKENGKDFDIHKFCTYERYGVDSETIAITDSNNTISDLLINSPVRRINMYVKDLSIAEAKYLLGGLDEHTMINAFKRYYKFGEAKTQRLITTINLYDKVLSKQYLETGNRSRGKNLLYVDYDEKLEIVRDNLYQMTECLVESGDNFIWGKLSDKNKLRLMEAVKNIDSEEYASLISNLLDMFTKYCTLNELKQGATKQKTLRKFIAK